MSIIYTDSGPVAGGQDAGQQSSPPKSSTQYLYFDVDTGVTTIAPDEGAYYSGKGKVVAVSSGGGGPSGASSSINAITSNSAAVNNAIQTGNIVTIRDGSITGRIGANAYYNPGEQRIYDPAADRVISTIASQNPGMDASGIAALTRYQDAVMPVDEQYVAAYLSAKNPPKEMMDYGSFGHSAKAMFTPLAGEPLAYVPKDDTGVYRVLGDSGRGDRVFYQGKDVTGKIIVPSMLSAPPRTKTWMADGSPVPESRQPEMGATERMYRQAEAHNIFRDVPFFGPAGTTMLAGAEGASYRLMGGQESVPTVENIAVGGAALFAGGYGIGQLAAPIILYGGAGALPVAATAVKVGAATTGFDIAYRATGEGLAAVGERRLPSLENMHLEAAFTPERIGTNIVLGAALAGPSQTIFLKAGAAGFPLAGQVILSSGAAGASFALANEAASGQPGKDFGKAAVTGGALGAAFGLAGMQLQKKGIRPVFEEEAYYTAREGQPPAYEIRGWKAGVEYVSPKGGGMKFIGVNPSIGAPAGGAGTVITPTGVVETRKIANSNLEKAYLGESKAYFDRGNRIDPARLESNIEQVMGVNSRDFVAKTGKAGLVIGGSTVEKAIGDFSSQPGARGLGKSDIDVVGYGTSRAQIDAYAKSMYGKAVRGETPLQYKGYPVTVEKYSISAYGKNVDVSVINPMAVQPIPPTPLGSFMESFTFTKTRTPSGQTVTTYSPQQQIASKFMTLGSMDGKVTTFEQGKSKYLADTNAIVRSATGKPLGGITPNEPATAATVASALSIAPIGSRAPSSSMSSVSPLLKSIMGSKSSDYSGMASVPSPSRAPSPSSQPSSRGSSAPRIGSPIFRVSSPPSAPPSSPPSGGSSGSSSDSSASSSSPPASPAPIASGGAATPLGPLMLPFLPRTSDTPGGQGKTGKGQSGAYVRDLFSGLRRVELAPKKGRKGLRSFL